MQRIHKVAIVISVILIAGLASSFKRQTSQAEGDVKSKSPKIVNIVNFIRLLEPRDPLITQEVLYQTVVKQVEVMTKNRLGGTFLLQYDALMDARYQKLLKGLPKGTFEIGAWWELPQPLIEKAGLKWRGRYPWDWHADVGFSTGYTPQEREKLIDVYMEDFKKIFGYYPKSVASWFIDAHSLNYMYDKYKIVASANCKDQYGTDGYTLWGGYWNQAYYPSRINSYMPAQTISNQLPIPVFRMLGSDPIRQYDTGLGNSRQGVVSLEPVYPEAGGSAAWVNWFFKEFVEGEALAFNYTQAGQENSFTWNGMSKGFEMQMPLISRLRDQGKIRVETLEASGRWFRNNFKLTPATSFTVNNDLPGSDLKTVWFNSRFYRTNILWEDGSLRIRDIHMFDEKLPSVYTTQKATSNECQFFTLPVVDGYLWSKKNHLAGLRLKAVVGGKEVLVKGGTPVITSTAAGKLHITWPLTTIKGTLVMDLNENQMAVSVKDGQGEKWFLDLAAAKSENLPFKNIDGVQARCEFEGLTYTIPAVSGSFSKPGSGQIFRVSPTGHNLTLDFSNGRGVK
ncbi:hypothetical protein DYBT9275_00058 [Dyadobacter sp. CECT 9275]|uniref:Uncharacterized protein n=1 Tax=Dyadobacter helix TaxID=2822344 RepID=A0A916J7U3_9BACT|nr:hypothetical protein [Dyadobacter sp. CECT 9275]CAG4988335.1 hypothetical protein DYBT9275_00058 [Dyadobacter sp. CECT 9275]